MREACPSTQYNVGHLRASSTPLRRTSYARPALRCRRRTRRLLAFRACRAEVEAVALRVNLSEAASQRCYVLTLVAKVSFLTGSFGLKLLAQRLMVANQL